MEENYRYYERANGKRYKVSEEQSSEFEKDFPDAKINVAANGKKYLIDINQRDEFFSDWGDGASYTNFDEQEESAPKKDSLNNILTSVNDSLMIAQHGMNKTFADSNMKTVTSTPVNETSLGETITKGIGAAGVGTAKLALDLGRTAWRNSVLGKFAGKDFDEAVRDTSNPLTKASMKLGEIQERLSMEADPTGGEKGFVDLLSEGKFGTAMQKALGSGLESLPMMVVAASGPGALVYGAGMAASTYSDETRENPDIPAWKRGAYALGSAATELAVERIGGPLKNIFKKAGGELTEAAAKEILEKVAKDGTDTIAKRIFGGLKKIGKEGLEEGGEEVLTSFGNDAIGEALDIIDGDKDYGIRAQWEKEKEMNPDADMAEFAKNKAKEYLDSFLGGALSGMQISSVSTVAGEVSEARARDKIQEAHAVGEKMDYGDIYDTDNLVREDAENVLSLFTNENGEETIGKEFIDGLSAEDAFVLSRHEDLTPEQRSAFAKLSFDKSVQEGLAKKLDDRLNEAISERQKIIEQATENNSVITGTYNGKEVFVKGAAIKDDGSITLPDGQNGPVVIIDVNDGTKQSVRSEEISSAKSTNALDYGNNLETAFRAFEKQERDNYRNTMSVRAKHRAIQPYAGKKILVDLGNGTTEVFVQKISNNGDVVIKGKKGDLGGQSILTLSSDVFYDSIYRDSDGNPVVTEAGPQEAEQDAPQEQAPETEIPQTPVEPADFRDFTDTIIINGKPIKVDEVTAQDDVSDSITYRYTDENGVQRTGNMTIGAFAEAVNLGRQQTETPAPAPEPEPEPEPAPIVAAGETPVPATETPAPTEAPVPTEQPVPINWDDLLDNNPESYFTEMQGKHGEKTEKRLSAVISAMQNQLDALNKAKPQTQDEIFENEERKELFQGRIDKLNGMVARLTAPAAPEAPAEAAPVAETPDTPAGETPAPAPEVPSEPAPAPTEPAPTLAPETPSTPEGEAPAAPVGEAPATPNVPTTPESAPAPAPQPAPAPVYDSSSNKAGNGLERMVKSFKSQIDKLIKKTSVKDFVGTDNTRPVMTGVYRENGYEYASDSMILVKVKAQYPAEQEGKIISAKTGKEIEGKYPKADVVIESSIDGTSKLPDNIDNIIAYAQTLEEIKKGMVKDAKLYVRVGNSIFDSTRLLTAAKMAKKHGLTNILQKGEANRAMVFEGVNGVVLVMPTNNTKVSENIIDIASGRAEFGYNALNYLKTPTTLKGIEAAKTTLEAVLPRLGLIIKDEAKESGELQYVNGNVVWRFDKNDIAKAKDKANDPNTYAALEEIEKNGLVVPMSLNDAETIFPELFVSEPTSIGDTTPTAPNPVANPIDEAKKKERQLIINLAKIGLAPEAKQDLAYNAGKAVADMFPTREAYDTYAETAADFGAYNADFERGVEDSFAARNQQNTGNTPVNSVPLENEPNGEDNGTEGTSVRTNVRRHTNRGVRGAANGEGQGSDTGNSEEEGPKSQSEGNKGEELVEDKYPARKGNATGQLLVDTFGLDSVTIPDTQKKILNTIYDFMMEMSKTLGISPKTIGQGGWLNIRNKPTRRIAIASHEMTNNRWTGEITDVSLRFKYSRLSSIAHEWWHSLDRALSYFETGKKADTATSISESAFTGRKETWDAVQAIMKALNDSGYTDRIRNLVKGQTPKTQAYFLSPTEQAARAFDEYITNRFAEAGITIENYDNHRDVTQPTAEEMKVVTPAIENLFKVLQEKEGKKPGTSVLYQIGEIVDTNVSQEAHQLATQAVLDMLRANGIAVVEATDDMVEQMLRSPELIDKMSQSKSVEEFDAVREKSKEEHGIVAANLSDRILRVTKVPLHNFSGNLTVAAEKAKEWALKNITNIDNPTTIHEGTTDEFTYVINNTSVKEFFEGTAFRNSEKYVKAAYLSVIGNIKEVISNCIETEVHPDYIDKKDGKRDVNGRISFDVLIHEYRGVINVDGQPFKIKLIFKETRSTSQDNPVYAYDLETIKLSGVTSEESSNEVAQQTLYAPNSLVSASKLLNGIEKSYDKGKNLLEESYKTSKKVGKYEIIQTTQGTVYGWTDGKKIYLTNAGINPNTPIHEYTHLWAKAMMQKNPKGWNSIKKLLKGTPVWNDVVNDANYSNIHNDEDAVASEALSRISGTENAAKLEQMAQQMVDEAKGTMRKAEARGLIQNMKDALNKFWNWVGTNLFGIENFESVEQVTDRVLYDLLNNTDLGELSEGQVETQIVTDPKVIAELEASPKRTGYRNVVQNEDGTFSSPMAYWLQSTRGGAKTRVETAKFELGKWEEAEEHPELVDEKGHVTLVKPNKSTVEVAYDPYIHNRLDPVNLQFKDAWKRDELVYVETEVPETDLESGYHADAALLPVGIHSWSNGDLMLSKYDKPVRIMPWEDVANAWVERLNGEGVHFDVVPPALRQPLVERGVEILPPHKGMGKDCNDAYKAWKDSVSENNSLTSQSYENTEDAYATNDGRGTQPETEGIQGEVSLSGPLGEGRRLARPENGKVSQSDFSRFNPIHEREGESDNRRNLRETRFFETFEKLTIDEKLMLYNFLRESFHNSSGILRSMTRNFINTVRQNGNNSFADFVESFVNDELKYREGISAKNAARHGVLIGVSYDASRLEQIFDAYNEDKYNETLFDRAIRLAKRFGVSIKFATRNEDGSFFSAFGNYNPSDNTITLDANLLVNGNTAELCQTIVHELIHSVVARAASIMSGRAVDNNKQFIDPQSLPKDVIDGINTLKEVYDAIKDDGTFQDTYGKKDFEEMLSEITDSKFRGLLKAKKLWKKFLNGICRILGIADESSSESDALTEIESALDKILSSAERGELDSAYASYLGQLAEGYTLDDLQRLESGPVKTMLTQSKLFRTGIDPTQVATQTASLVYDQVVSDSFQEFQRQFQDAMQPVRIAIDAIQQETGNIPIEDYENYILIQNQSSSRSRVETDDFARRYYSPIIKQVNEIINTILESRGYKINDEAKRSEVYKEVKTYLIAKHGLERNKYYQTHKTRKMKGEEMKPELDQAKQDYDDKVNQINSDTTLTDAERQLQLRDALDEYNATVEEIKTREVPDIRDYSGLTTLFATEDLDEAERLAQEAVDKFENEVNTDELWAKINAATYKTLRHSYESGLLSRQQYNDIKNMFQFYIPLRGFDESTAEDVYAYARFEGNRFNPAVQKAKGRTSLSDDPIAIIMNMAESEIAQGNKNRAKQALYNYLLNRSDGLEKQNSLMQIESVWAIKTIDAFGNELYVIASPDHAAGETLEEFEERMQVMAEAGLAKKSQKGHVDVGMRFQKPSNKDAHYVYLKVNGVEKAIYINGNPKAADAINGTYAPMPSEFMQKVKDVQRLVSSTFTNYSLEFTARNFFRDMIYSHINIGVRESDPAYRKKFRQNWRHNNMGTMIKFLKSYRSGEFDGRPLTADEVAFVEFMNNGGQTGYTLINSVETHKKELERAIERMQKGIVKGGVKDTTIFRYTLGGIELLNEASELVTRFAAFKTSRDMGRGINRSINDAKEITVNFNTKGAQDGTGWMGVVARYLGAVKYFFNASVQGVQNLYKAFQKNKLKFGSVVGGTIGLGMLMPVLQGALSELMGGDEDEYWNIPEYDRQNNLCFVIGKGKYVKLPLPIGFREMYGLGDLMMAGMLDKKFVRNPLSVGMDVANKIATIVLPINPLEGSVNGLSLIESGQDMLLPDVTQGIMQNRTNTDFMGKPIQKEYTYNEYNPQWTKAFASNPAWLTGLSKWCYEHIEYDGLAWDWSPEKLDNTFSNAFGGIYSLLKKAGRTVSAIWNEDNRTLSNVPLVGVIVGSNIDDDQRFVNSAYWEMDEYYNKRIFKIENTAKGFGITLDDVFARNPEGERAGEHHPAMNKIYNSDYFDFMQEWYLGHKGEGETDENGEKILGLSQIKNKIKYLENKIKKNEDGVATSEQDEELVELNNLYEATRRDLVNDLLELD